MIEVLFSTKLAVVFLISMIGLAEAGEVQVTSSRVLEDLVPVDCGPQYTPPNNKFGINV
jgi:hypothetical protein